MKEHIHTLNMFVLYFGDSALQKMAQTPFKTRGPIWVPGMYTTLKVNLTITWEYILEYPWLIVCVSLQNSQISKKTVKLCEDNARFFLITYSFFIYLSTHKINTKQNKIKKHVVQTK